MVQNNCIFSTIHLSDIHWETPWPVLIDWHVLSEKRKFSQQLFRHSAGENVNLGLFSSTALMQISRAN